MSSRNDYIGALGEALVSGCLQRPSSAAGEILFSPHYLGEKSELWDFIVLLVDKKGHTFGPHFFLQVKTTDRTAAVKKHSIAAAFSADERRWAHAWKAPGYLAAVDARMPGQENIYIQGLSTDQLTGTTSVSFLFSLHEAATRQLLYDEVKMHFEKTRFQFLSKLNRWS